MTTGGVKCFNAHTVAIELDAQTSSRLLERVQRSNAPMTMAFSQCGEECAVEVQLQSADAQVLQLCPPASGRFNDILPSTCLEVQFALDGQAYFFTSSTLVCNEDCMQIGRPTNLHTWQRRRFMRASIAKSTAVKIMDLDMPGQLIGEGAMLNVSQDGLACRLGRDVADRIDIDERIGVEFEIGDERIALAVDGRVKSKTAGGSPNTIIVGICFNHDPLNQEARKILRQHLNE
ncbi:MAG TPA: PilZ domain-containing protein [Phycisphaerae bacterium]|nr:PilZ domain-containing protein [Phycisphaerae bacterium]